jgi:hypothetical protein
MDKAIPKYNSVDSVVRRKLFLVLSTLGGMAFGFG